MKEKIQPFELEIFFVNHRGVEPHTFHSSLRFCALDATHSG